MPNLSSFPDGGIDNFLRHYDAISSDIPHLKRIQELQLKEAKTPAESIELTQLIGQYRDKLFLAEDMNHLKDAIVNLQSFFLSSVDGYITTKQSEFNTYVNSKTSELNTSQINAINTINSTKITAENNIQSIKDSALISIEQKKENILVYMDSTTAGQIRNDIGIKAELTTTAKDSLVNAINEIDAKEYIHFGTTPPVNTSLLWVDLN